MSFTRKSLNYKEILFDDYTEDEYGTWSEICETCANKHISKIESEIDDGDSAMGLCGVLGCENNGNNDGKHYYIDFKKDCVSFVNMEVI